MLRPLIDDISNGRNCGPGVGQRPAVFIMQDHRPRLHLAGIRSESRLHCGDPRETIVPKRMSRLIKFARLRYPATVSILRNVIRPREVVFAWSLKPSHPSPGERVGSRVTVQKVVQKESSTHRPWKLQREYPNARKPHSYVVVKIACGS